MTLNFGFFVGEIDNPQHHLHYELYIAIVVNLIATILKFGDRTQIGAIHLATSLVADIQLIAGAVIWAAAGSGANDPEIIVAVVSLSGGAFLANITSVVLLIYETVTLRR
jgi:putative Ca2+/H+ antiporter (TMEM165/GDT1 family)